MSSTVTGTYGTPGNSTDLCGLRLNRLLQLPGPVRPLLLISLRPNKYIYTAVNIVPDRPGNLNLFVKELWTRAVYDTISLLRV